MGSYLKHSIVCFATANALNVCELLILYYVCFVKNDCAFEDVYILK